MNKAQQFRAFGQGALNSLPMVLAAIPFGILFGVLAPANGIAGWVAVAFSALVFAGASQYVAIGQLWMYVRFWRGTLWTMARSKESSGTGSRE